MDKQISSSYLEVRNGQERIFNYEITQSEEVADSSSDKDIHLKSGTVRLKRQLGIPYGVAIILGLSVGGGIYISPQTVLRNAGSPGLTLIIWVIGGINALFGSLVFAEIGIHIPIAGEGYPYLCELYNPYIGFMYVWQYLLLVRPGSNALKFIIFGRYLLKPLFQDCEIPKVAILLLATAMSIFVTALNCMNLKFIARGQSILSGMSVATLMTLASLGIYFIVTGRVENLENPFKDSNIEQGGLILALYATMYAFNGWSALNFIIEELHNPNRTIPVAISVSNILLTLLYVSVNLAYLVVLPKDEMLSSEAVAISAIMKVSSWGGWIMSVLIALTACSSSNSGHLVASRLAFAASRNGHFPSSFSFISISQFTPIVSVVSIGVTVVVFIWFIEVEQIMANIMFSGVVGDLLVSIGYIRRRYQSRFENDDKFKVSIIIHIVYCISLFVVTIIPLFINPSASVTGFALVVFTSSMYYLMFVKLRLFSNWTGTDRINYFIQKLFNCAPPEKTH